MSVPPSHEVLMNSKLQKTLRSAYSAKKLPRYCIHCEVCRSEDGLRRMCAGTRPLSSAQLSSTNGTGGLGLGLILGLDVLKEGL